MPDEGFYAPGARRPTATRSRRSPRTRVTRSAAGHRAAGRRAAVADRLLAPDLFNGWGVRTLSDDHPSYNPFAYHLGAVWPVENATFALGFKRYGLDDHVDRLVSAVLGAAAASPGRPPAGGAVGSRLGRGAGPRPVSRRELASGMVRERRRPAGPGHARALSVRAAACAGRGAAQAPALAAGAHAATITDRACHGRPAFRATVRRVGAMERPDAWPTARDRGRSAE